MEDLGCEDRRNIQNCNEIVRLADCDVPCATGNQGEYASLLMVRLINCEKYSRYTNTNCQSDPTLESVY